MITLHCRGFFFALKTTKLRAQFCKKLNFFPKTQYFSKNLKIRKILLNNMLKITENKKIFGLLRCQRALKFTVILFFATKVDENLEKSKNLLKFWKKLTQFFKNSIKIFSKTQKYENLRWGRLIIARKKTLLCFF